MDVIWWLVAFGVGIIGNLIASELFGWSPRIAEWLVHRAARRLAPGMQERMIEEWQAHLQAIPGGLSRIVAALGFLVATRQINVALKVREREKRKHRQGSAKSRIIMRGHDGGYDIDISVEMEKPNGSRWDTPIVPDWLKPKPIRKYKIEMTPEVERQLVELRRLDQSRRNFLAHRKGDFSPEELAQYVTLQAKLFGDRSVITPDAAEQIAAITRAAREASEGPKWRWWR